jgi:predicted dienelactone hydrolase
LGLAFVVPQGCARPPVRPVESMGPWAVGFRRATAVDHERGDRSLPLGIWYPVEPAQAKGRRASYVCYKHPLLTLRVKSDTAIWDAPISRARKWPLVIFSHGAPSLETQSPNYVETLASRGFVVVGIRHVGSTIFDKSMGSSGPAERTIMSRDRNGEVVAQGEEVGLHEIVAAARGGEKWALELVGNAALFHLTRPFDVWLTIDWVAEQSGSPSSFLCEAVDPTRVGVTGHSAGGCTTLGAAAGYGEFPPDPRIKAILPIAPAGTSMIPEGTLRTVAAPVLFVAGARDQRAPWEKEARRAWALVSSRPAEVARIRRVAHCHFADVDGFAHRVKSIGIYPWAWRWAGGQRLLGAYREVHADGMLSPYEAQRILNKYAVAFFGLHLQGDRGCAATLTAAYAREHEPAVEFLTLPSVASEGPGNGAVAPRAGDPASGSPVRSHTESPAPGN